MATMRALFLSAQLPSHLDWGGYLPTAATLARRGHEVIWASGDGVQGLVQGAGVRFHPLASTGWRWPPPPPLHADAAPDAESLRSLKQQRALDQWLDVERVATAVEEIVDLGRKFRPDLIVSEMFVAAAGLAAEMLETPLVVAGWPAPAAVSHRDDPMIDVARTRLQELLARFHLRGRNWTAEGPPALLSPHLHVTYWSPSWFEGVPMRPQTRHVGGFAPATPPDPPSDLPAPEDAPWALITLGTSFNRDPNFFITAAHAAARMGCLPILSFGADLATPWIEETLPRLPSIGDCQGTCGLRRCPASYRRGHTSRRRGHDPRSDHARRSPDCRAARRRPDPPGTRRGSHRHRPVLAAEEHHESRRLSGG